MKFMKTLNLLYEKRNLKPSESKYRLLKKEIRLKMQDGKEILLNEKL